MATIRQADLPKLEAQLRTLISTPSVSCTSPSIDTSNRAVVEQLATWFRALGFEVELLEVPGYPGKVNMLATLGKGPGGLVLSGHSDTVPFDAHRWRYDPLGLTNVDNRFYGLGTSDMKGFFTVVIEALRSLAGQTLQQPLMVLATADEETSMCGARALAELGRPKARYAVIGEPTGLKPIRMHKGIMMEKVKVFGQAGHSSNPDLGHNALDIMQEVLALLLEYQRELRANYQHPGFKIDFPTLNLGCIHGGDNPNRICGECEVHFDLRSLPGMPVADLRGTLADRLQTLSQKTATRIELSSLVEHVESFEQAATSDIVKLAEKLSGHSAESVAFATEAPFLQGLGMETIVLGPGSIDQAHQPDEYLDHAFIKPAVELVRQLIVECCLTAKT